MSDQEQIETALAKVERPSYVTEVRYVLDDDWSGDPAVRIWVIVRDDITQRAEILEHTEPVRSSIVPTLFDAEVDRWPYVHSSRQVKGLPRYPEAHRRGMTAGEAMEATLSPLTQERP